MRRVDHVTLFTHDVAAMTSFYRIVLGGEPAYSDEHITIFRRDDFSLLIHAILDHNEGGLPFEDHFSFHVADAKQACDSFRRHGITMEHDPADYSWGRSAYLRDPDGRLVEIHEEARDGMTD